MIIFLDLEKAFDPVKLFSKLYPLLKHISKHISFASNKWLWKVKTPSTRKVQSRIPRGSVLGCPFFLIFINGIVHPVSVKVRLLADDCTKKSVALRTRSLENVQSWCANWQMIINEKNTVSITKTRKQKPSKCSCSTNDHDLSALETYKYLGILMTSDLKWNECVSYIEKKAMRKLATCKG